MNKLISNQKGKIRNTAIFIMFVFILLTAFIVLLNVDSCVILNNCSEEKVVYDTAKVYFETKSDRIPLTVELALDNEQRAKGLMDRPYLDPNWGMLFIMSSEAKQTFWMKNVLIPLDMIFLNKDKKIVDIKENVPICDPGETCPYYTSDEKALYVVEVNSGWSKSKKISLGDTMVLTAD